MPPKRKAATQPEPIFAECVFTFTPAAERSADGSKAQKLIKERGGSLVASVTKKLTHLVALPEDVNGDKVPSKVKAAGSAGRPIHFVTPEFILTSSEKDKLQDASDFDPKSDSDGGDDTPMPDAAADKDDAAADSKTDTKPRAAKRRKVKDEVADEEEEKEEEKEEDAKPAPKPEVKEKIVKALKKGKVPVDHKCPKQTVAHVYEDGDEVFDAMLNQTDIGNNNNKFYIIQLLEEDNQKKYWVWNRWGRVGVDGQNKLDGPLSLDAAKRSFEKKFHDKTKNRWEDRADFEKVAGKYFLIERDFSNEDEAEEAEVKDEEDKKPAKTPDSKLAKPVQELVKLIFNLDMMKTQMVEIGYDANKMPLGKLSKANMQKGYKVLKEIADVLNGADANKGAVLMELSSQFYTIIPHNFGMRRPPPINTAKLVKDKLEMIESLGDIDIATTLMKDVKQQLDKNPIDVEYGTLKCDLSPIERDASTFKLLEKYMLSTHGATHSYYTLELLDLFEVNRNGEDERFVPYGGKLHNRQLLWHGSRLTNFVGILSQGLRIAPPEAPVTGYMFGKGIYFADMVSKSANYCFTNRNQNTGILLLCEVALGDTNKLKHADYNAGETAAKNGKHSTWGVGRNLPDPKEAVKLEDGVHVPTGKPIRATEDAPSLEYNEFIVYRLDQVKIRYLLKVKFNYR
ncbi:Poly [ADP-ribose] polymerase 2 [Rhizophlyctis rosea]|nr:Poly [ADP-ribose] polymerase 2 [Rhizophlyctis rosea]